MNKPINSPTWKSLANALRLELQEYGALLNLLNEQQGGILGRDPENLINLNLSIEKQIEMTNSMRTNRVKITGALALDEERPQSTPIGDLLDDLPDSVRPLLEALIDDIRAILDKLRTRARQNQMLLSRARELTEDILQTLQPQERIKTYGAGGKLSYKTGKAGGCIEANV